MSTYSGDISIGVIGAGGMGARHATNLSHRVTGARVAGVTDIDLTRAEELASRCGPDAKAFESESALIEDGGVDAVVVVSPDDTHAGLVMQCLRQGKPVLCEKPLATSATAAREIVDAEVDYGRKLVQVGFMRRYDPQHVDVAEAVASGAIGNPVLFKGAHRNLGAAPGATSESILFNSAVHDLDSARWFLGEEIEEVFVRGADTAGAGEALDLQVIQLSMSGGRLADIEVYVNAGYGYEVDAEVVGDAGTVRIAPANAPILRSGRHAGHSVEEDWLERFPEAYVLEMQRWTEGLHAGDLIGPDAWDGYMALLAVEACVASVESGSTERLQAPETPGLYRNSLSGTPG